MNTTKTIWQQLARYAWLVILVVDAAFIPWGGMGALAPAYLPGPGGTPILIAEYEGYTGAAWSEFITSSPKQAELLTILFRMYCIYCVIFGFLGVAIAATAFRRGERWAWWALLISNTIALGSAITFDRVVRAIGLFEITEYFGLLFVFLALAITFPYTAIRSSTVVKPF